jgi:hypothetical protein
VVASTHASRAHSLNRFGERTVAAQLFRFPQGLRFNRRIPVRNGFWPLSIWPDGVLTSQYDVPPVQEVPQATPEVIIVGGTVGGTGPAPSDDPASRTPPDYSYVPGCRAIPNGYHCDLPSDETAH